MKKLRKENPKTFSNQIVVFNTKRELSSRDIPGASLFTEFPVSRAMRN